jgi:serine/threonine protein kinase
VDDVPEQIGPYRLMRRIGAGGMGVVYEALDTMLERPVAIKMMHGLDDARDDAEELRSRFMLEARTAARIKSRHVVQILQLGVLPPSTINIVMELLSGVSLKAELKRAGPFAVPRAVRVASQIAEAMALAHDLGVVHRDLKPANVMLVDDGAEREVAKVLDFGIAKLTNSERMLTQAGVVLGTLAFMAPEQIAGRAIDGRTDLYALGMVLYRMLSGLPPWDSDDPASLVRLHREVTPPSLRVRVPGAHIPAGLDDVVLRCLQKSPDDRFPSMRALIAALAPYSGGAVPVGVDPLGDAATLVGVERDAVLPDLSTALDESTMSTSASSAFASSSASSSLSSSSLSPSSSMEQPAVLPGLENAPTVLKSGPSATTAPPPSSLVRTTAEAPLARTASPPPSPSPSLSPSSMPSTPPPSSRSRGKTPLLVAGLALVGAGVAAALLWPRSGDGVAVVDAGVAVVDAGVAVVAAVDAGTAVVDAGVAVVDAGAAVVDGGAAVGDDVDVDAGAAVVDAGLKTRGPRRIPVKPKTPPDAGTSTPGFERVYGGPR